MAKPPNQSPPAAKEPTYIDYDRGLRMVPELISAGRLDDARRLIARGMPPADALAMLEPWPPVAQGPLVAGASAGRLTEAARSAVKALDRSIERSVDRLTALLEPALVMVLALVIAGIGWLVLGSLYSGLAEVGG